MNKRLEYYCCADLMGYSYKIKKTNINVYKYIYNIYGACFSFKI